MTKTFLQILILILSSNVIIGQSIDAKLMELQYSNDGNPEKFTKAENGFYLTANYNELWFTDGTKEGTKFFASTESSFNIDKIIPIGEKVFFVADKTYSYQELWVTDGTKSGTIQLTDRGLNYSQEGKIYDIISFNDKVYFSAYDVNFGFELWVSDGTSEGTYMLKDINEGIEGSLPLDFFVFKNQLFFKAFTEEFNTELWSTDGTKEGTTLFKDINQGNISSLGYSRGYNTLGDNFYFFANDGKTGLELWKSDGTIDGTFLLKDINKNPGYGSNNSGMIGGIVNNQIVFIADDGVFGNELWISDGTESGTRLLKDIAPNSASAFYFGSSMVFSKSKIYFHASDNAQKSGLWVSDGTESGTNFLKQVSVSNLALSKNDESVFFYGDGSNYNSVLWHSDGTSNGTKMISDKAKASNISSHENDIIVFNNKVFFTAQTKPYGIELWHSDASDEGTSIFYDFNGEYGSNPTLLKTVGDQVFYRGNQYGYFGLCISDGTIEGNKYLDINLNGQSIHEESVFFDFNGKLVVGANDGIHGYEPWISDGTQEGTFLLKDINPGKSNSLLNSIFVNTFSIFNNLLYFYASDGTGGALWMSDGTTTGTIKISESGVNILFGGNGSDIFTQFNNDIYFYGSSTSGRGLYKLDTTTNNSTFIQSFSSIEHIYVANNRLLIIQDNGERTYPEAARELWVSDGSREGTSFLERFADDRMDHVITFKDELYFSARISNTADHALFKSDGTPEGTFPVFIANLPVTSYPLFNNLVPCGDYLYFGVENNSRSIIELWRTDGTNEGTKQLIDYDGSFNIISELSCFSDNLFFKQYAYPSKISLVSNSPNIEIFDFELNISNGPVPYNYYSLTVAENKMYFVGSTEKSGNEVYVLYPQTAGAGSNFPDADSDGVVDLFDECPNTQNGLKVNDSGCAENQLDDDSDGILNDSDLCPDTLSEEAVDNNGCSTSDLRDTDADGVYDKNDSCPSTPQGESVNEYGCSQSQLDDDEDGVMNDMDLCPDSFDFEVDIDGCPLSFELPSNNFKIMATGITCVDKNNGRLSIEAVEEHDYLIRLNGRDYKFKASLVVEDLSPGIYQVCITIVDKPEFIKCFNFEIANAATISGKSNSFQSNKNIIETVEITSGTAPFTVEINGKEAFITTSSVFSLDVKQGDLITVSTKLPCEGTFEKKIVLPNKIFFTPNPTSENIHIYLPNFEKPKVKINIYNTNLQLLESELHEINNGIINVSISDLPTGIYYFDIEGTEKVVIKVIKI